MKIISWNVNGIRACQKKGFLDYLYNTSPDILCLQETKANVEQLDSDLLEPKGYFCYFNSAIVKKGYSGVAIYTKKEPKEIKTTFTDERFNQEGRILFADYEDFLLVNLYFPNGQSSDERLQFKLAFNLQLIEELKPYKGRKIIVCGDYNTAHHEIDLKNPKENEKTSGFLPIERQFLDQFIEFGFTDTFRHLYPDTVKYSWWTYRAAARARNVGWRIDYHFINQELMPHLKEAFIENEVMGSDHCPVGVLLDI